MIKRILVTGGSGFLGSHLIKNILSTTDCEIVSLDNLNYSGNLNRFKQFIHSDNLNRLKIVYHDLRSEINETNIKLIGNIDVIIHLAANPHVDKSISDPLSTVFHNVVGTCNILNFAKNISVKDFVYFSTDEVFGTACGDSSFDEYSRYNSRNPYSASKAGAEELVSAFYHSYKLNAKVIHCNNIYGESQQSKAFIPICINNILHNKEICIHTDAIGTIPTRKYIYVEDVVSAIIKVLESSETHIEGIIPKYNIVSNEEISILDIAEKISSILKIKLKYNFSNSRPGVDTRYSLMGHRLKNLGWTQNYNFYETLPRVVNWFVANKEWL